MKSQEDELLTKTFVFENEASGKSENLQITMRANMDTQNINYVINIWKHKNEISSNLEYKIYDPEINRYVALIDHISQNKGYIYSPTIVIKYKQSKILHHLQNDDDIQSIASSKASSETKRQRNKERTIREVLEYVKQWRQIHKTLDEHNNKINLQQAAKIVGISKKSLDDYYYQLRLAEEYGFDFERNIDEKVGLLRTFVKQQRPKGMQGIKHERLPKKLKILQTLGKDFITKKPMVVQQQQNIIQAQYEPPMPVIPQDQYENRFYNSFNFMLDQPQDPFIMIGRKQMDQSQEEYSYL